LGSWNDAVYSFRFFHLLRESYLTRQESSLVTQLALCPATDGKYLLGTLPE